MPDKRKIDPEMKEFEEALLRSLEQAHNGEYARVHTPEQIVARRRGRPQVESPKVPTTIRFDSDVLEALKATGKGWQTRVNEAMREWVKRHKGKAAA